MTTTKTAPRLPIVCFNTVEEFLDEAARYADAMLATPEGFSGVARVTTLRRQDPQFVSLLHFFTVAGFVTGEQLVELYHYVGDGFAREQNGPRESHTQKTIDALDREIERITSRLAELGFDVRAGRFSYKQMGC